MSASIFRIIFLSGLFFVLVTCQQTVGRSDNLVEENENLEALTSPENFIADWLPALNKLGLALANLKLKSACVDLRGVLKQLESPSCTSANGDGGLSRNLTDLLGVLNKLADQGKALEDEIQNVLPPQSISAILVRTADVHNLRVNANLGVKTTVEAMRNLQSEQGCLKERNDLESLKKEIDTAVDGYWSKVTPITSSVFKVTYGQKGREKFRQLVDETFLT